MSVRSGILDKWEGSKTFVAQISMLLTNKISNNFP